MSLQAIPPRPSPLHSLLRLVHDRNPFFLLSALSMFVGLRVVIAALDSAPGEWRTLLGLIVTTNGYELVLIALALFLIVRRGQRRDGWILLGIESLFLVDLTNLNAELYTALPRLGAVVSLACFGLALAKIAAVVRVLRLRVTPTTAAYVAVQLAFLFLLPGLFRLVRSSTAAVSPMQIYGVWWLAGTLMAVGAVVVRRDARTAGHPMAALPERLFVLVPLVSLLVHLASENRVYWVHFQTANVAPVLLAGVVALGRGRWNSLKMQWSVGLVVLAITASVVPDEFATPMSTHLLGFTVTPLRAALEAAALALALVAWRNRSYAVAVALATGAAVAPVGPTFAEMVRRLARAIDWAWDAAWQWVPQTPMQWGCTAIVAAFLLLGVGALLSLRGGVATASEPGDSAAGTATA